MLQTWNPKSKLEPYATSAAELMKIAKEAVNDFFEIPVGITDDLIYDLAEGFDNIFKDYTNLVAACGKKVTPSLFLIFSYVFLLGIVSLEVIFICGSNCSEEIGTCSSNLLMTTGHLTVSKSYLVDVLFCSIL